MILLVYYLMYLSYFVAITFFIIIYFNLIVEKKEYLMKKLKQKNKNYKSIFEPNHIN